MNCSKLSEDSYTNITNMLPQANNLSNTYISNLGLSVDNFSIEQIAILNAKGYTDAIAQSYSNVYHISINTTDTEI